MTEEFIFISTNQKTKKMVVDSWEKAIEKFLKYFPLEEGYKVVTVDNFTEYCHIIRENRPKWGVSKQKNGKIYLYNPTKWTKNETGHQPEDAVPSLIHELFHLYCYKDKSKLPKWLEEGLATYLSQDFDGGQKDSDFLKLKRKYIKIPDLPNLSDDFSSHLDHSWSYLSAYTFVKYIIKNEGREFIKKIPVEYKAKNKLFINNVLFKWKQFMEEQNE